MIRFSNIDRLLGNRGLQVGRVLRVGLQRRDQEG